jgi:hypothetical protein
MLSEQAGSPWRLTPSGVRRIMRGGLTHSFSPSVDALQADLVEDRR